MPPGGKRTVFPCRKQPFQGHPETSDESRQLLASAGGEIQGISAHTPLASQNSRRSVLINAEVSKGVAALPPRRERTDFPAPRCSTRTGTQAHVSCKSSNFLNGGFLELIEVPAEVLPRVTPRPLLGAVLRSSRRATLVPNQFFGAAFTSIHQFQEQRRNVRFPEFQMMVLDLLASWGG